MARHKRTPQQELVASLRTQSLLAYILDHANLFGTEGQTKEISLDKMIHEIQQVDRNTDRSKDKPDYFAERKFERWISGHSCAEKEIDGFLNYFVKGGFTKAYDAYMKGPEDSLFFYAIDTSIESAEFSQASGMDEIDRQLSGQQRLSDYLTKQAFHRQLSSTEKEKLMEFTTLITAWFRYALITRHSIDYLVSSINQVLNKLASLQRTLVVGKGAISHPISTDRYCDFLIRLTADSTRYRAYISDLINNPEELHGREGWSRIAQLIAPEISELAVSGDPTISREEILRKGGSLATPNSLPKPPSRIRSL